MSPECPGAARLRGKCFYGLREPSRRVADKLTLQHVPEWHHGAPLTAAWASPRSLSDAPGTTHSKGTSESAPVPDAAYSSDPWRQNRAAVHVEIRHAVCKICNVQLAALHLPVVANVHAGTFAAT